MIDLCVDVMKRRGSKRVDYLDGGAWDAVIKTGADYLGTLFDAFRYIEGRLSDVLHTVHGEKPKDLLALREDVRRIYNEFRHPEDWTEADAARLHGCLVGFANVVNRARSGYYPGIRSIKVPVAQRRLLEDAEAILIKAGTDREPESIHDMDDSKTKDYWGEFLKTTRRHLREDDE